MRQRVFDVSDAMRELGFTGLQAMLVALREGLVTQQEVNDRVEAGILAGAIRSYWEDDALTNLPAEGSMAAGFAAVGPEDVIPKGDSERLVREGWCVSTERMLQKRTDDYVNAGLDAVEARWAAVNDISNDTGERGRVARAIRKGWVDAVTNNVQEHGSEEDKAKLSEMRSGGAQPERQEQREYEQEDWYHR